VKSSSGSAWRKRNFSVASSSYTVGDLIHILLVVAIVIVLVRVIQGRRPV
jgi:hypothetical protein